MCAWGLKALSGKMSTRYLQLARASLARAIRYAEAHDLVGRNVATLVDNPRARDWPHAGRPTLSCSSLCPPLVRALGQAAGAKAVFACCLVRGQCLAYAILTGPAYGIRAARQRMNAAP